MYDGWCRLNDGRKGWCIEITEEGEDHGHAEDSTDREFEIFAEENVALRDLGYGEEADNDNSH